MNTEPDKSFLKEHNISTRRIFPYSSLVCIVAGVILFATQIMLSGNDDKRMPLLLIAFLLVVIGVVKIFLGGRRYVYNKSNEIMNEEVLYFEQTQKDVVENRLQNGEFAHLRNSAINNFNLSLMVELYTTKSGSVAMYRIYKYIPYEFEPIGEMQFYQKGE